jgi:hypothetical protein
MNKKQKTLQTILNNCINRKFDLAFYDMTLRDSQDEADAGGFWDLAGDLADYFLESVQTLQTDTDQFNYARTELQSLLYNLLVSYRTRKTKNKEVIQ